MKGGPSSQNDPKTEKHTEAGGSQSSWKIAIRKPNIEVAIRGQVIRTLDSLHQKKMTITVRNRHPSPKMEMEMEIGLAV